MQQQKFCIDRFKHDKTHIKFYTGSESFDIFKAVLQQQIHVFTRVRILT